MARTGRCLCGAVTYELDGELLATALCHCSHCQRQGGGAFSVNLVVHESQLSVSGDLKTYEETGERGDDVSKLTGTTQNDLVKEYLARGTYIFPPEQSQRIIAEMYDEGYHARPFSDVILDTAGLSPEESARRAAEAIHAILG